MGSPTTGTNDTTALTILPVLTQLFVLQLLLTIFAFFLQMHLMYTLSPEGKRIYTLKVRNTPLIHFEVNPSRVRHGSLCQK
jgi:hypothetical protein